MFDRHKAIMSPISLDRVRELVNRSNRQVEIITNRKRIAEYDDEHPERILCILRKPNESFQCVVTKNRDNDTESQIALWLRKTEYMDQTECAICFEKMHQASTCFQCYTMICEACYFKLYDDVDNVMKCPACRTWALNGSEFGCPASTLNIVDRRSEIADPIDYFVDIVKQLDGLISIIPRIYQEFHFHKSMIGGRKSFTTRYIEGSLKLETMRKKLRKLLQPGLRLYILRKTYVMDKVHEKPVVELSVFAYNDLEKSIFALKNDAYVDVLPEEVNFHRVKTEIVRPREFTRPVIFCDIFKEIRGLFPNVASTVAISTSNSSYGCNFDMDRDGRIETIHDDMLNYMLTGIMEKSFRIIIVTVRGHVHGTDINTSHFTAFAIENDAINRYVDSKKIWARNVDGLKSSRFIEKWL